MFRRIFETLALVVFSLGFALFAAFLLFDTYPELLGARRLVRAVFATRRDYVPDDKLVFRRRPTTREMDYKGDQWVDKFEELGVREKRITSPRPSTRMVSRRQCARSRRCRRDGRFVHRNWGEQRRHVRAPTRDRLRLPRCESRPRVVRAYQYLEVFRRYGVKRQPKFAVFCFFEGNDLEDTVQYRNWRGGAPYYHFDVRTTTPVWERFRIALADTWVFATGFTRKPVVIPDSFFAAQLIEIDLGAHKYKSRWRYFPDVRPTAEILASDEGRGVREVLHDFRRAAEDAGIQPVVVFIPTPARIYAPYTTKRSGGDWLAIRDASLKALTHVEDAARTLTAEAGLPFVDLAGPFAAAARRGEVIYYPFDTHWNAAGRKLAADYVNGALEKFIPSRPSKHVAE